MTVVSPGVQSSRETQRRGRGKCGAELQWLAVVAASSAVGALESSRRRATRMNGGKGAPVVSAAEAGSVAGYQKSKLGLLQAKEMLRLAPPFF